MNKFLSVFLLFSSVFISQSFARGNLFKILSEFSGNGEELYNKVGAINWIEADKVDEILWNESGMQTANVDNPYERYNDWYGDFSDYQHSSARLAALLKFLINSKRDVYIEVEELEKLYDVDEQIKLYDTTQEKLFHSKLTEYMKAELLGKNEKGDCTFKRGLLDFITLVERDFRIVSGLLYIDARKALEEHPTTDDEPSAKLKNLDEKISQDLKNALAEFEKMRDAVNQKYQNCPKRTGK